VVEVDFAELTPDGHIRHGSFIGIRLDKPARAVIVEEPRDNTEIVAGIRISNPERRVFRTAAFTKLDVARYYDRAGERVTQTAGHRPMSLLRAPRGIDDEVFFQKYGQDNMPAALKRITLDESGGTVGDYLYAIRPLQSGHWCSTMFSMLSPDRAST
jgi:bifunctional non-homologous end joining protein LigD